MVELAIAMMKEIAFFGVMKLVLMMLMVLKIWMLVMMMELMGGRC